MELILLFCPSKIHCDGLIKDLERHDYNTVRYDDRRVIVETNQCDEFSKLYIHHCAFAKTPDPEHLEAWSEKKGDADEY